MEDVRVALKVLGLRDDILEEFLPFMWKCVEMEWTLKKTVRIIADYIVNTRKLFLPFRVDGCTNSSQLVAFGWTQETADGIFDRNSENLSPHHASLEHIDMSFP